MRCLAPIWLTKGETARRVQARIEAVLDAAEAHGDWEGKNPAALRSNLGHLLPKAPKTVKHFAAVKYSELPAFIQALRAAQQTSTSSIALEFLILTAARTNEVLGARWQEIDLDRSGRKGQTNRAHQVPLSPRAVEILQTLNETRSGEWVFPSPRGGRTSHIVLQQILRRLKVEGDYRRGSALFKRRDLMNAWANFLEGRPAADNVISLTARR